MEKQLKAQTEARRAEEARYGEEKVAAVALLCGAPLLRVAWLKVHHQHALPCDALRVQAQLEAEIDDLTHQLEEEQTT